MLSCPSLPAVVDDPLSQKQFRDPVPTVIRSPRQSSRARTRSRAASWAGAGNRDIHDLSQMQQPGQMRGITGIGLDPITGRSLQLRRGSHPAIDTRRDQRPRQPETRRAGLIGHRHRRW